MVTKQNREAFGLSITWYSYRKLIDRKPMLESPSPGVTSSARSGYQIAPYIWLLETALGVGQRTFPEPQRTHQAPGTVATFSPPVAHNTAARPSRTQDIIR